MMIVDIAYVEVKQDVNDFSKRLCAGTFTKGNSVFSNNGQLLCSVHLIASFSPLHWLRQYSWRDHRFFRSRHIGLGYQSSVNSSIQSL